MAKMFGRARVRVDGAELKIDEGASLDIGGVQRNTVKGVDVYGYSEEAMPAEVDCDVYVDANTDLDYLESISDATVMFECDSGQKYVLAHAWSETPPKATAANNGGKVPMKFVAPKAEKV